MMGGMLAYGGGGCMACAFVGYWCNKYGNAVFPHYTIPSALPLCCSQIEDAVDAWVESQVVQHKEEK